MAEAADASPHSFVPPPRTGPRDSGDGWVEDGTGRKFWGRFGAAGLLAYDPARGILLQHRANWSHFGGTWGLPGGAKHAGESAVDGAIREANEEAGVPTASLTLAFTSMLDLGFWSYTTVIVQVDEQFDAMIADAESIEVRWVPVDEVDALPLHPGFEAAWSQLKNELGRATVLVVEGQARSASVGGATAGDSGDLGGGGDDGSGAESTTHQTGPGIRIVAAEHDGDQAIVDAVQRYFTGAAGPASDAVAGAGETSGAAAPGTTRGRVPRVFVVTADRELTDRVTALGATVHGPGWLWALLDGLPSA